MKNKNCIITGGAGFIGSTLADKLLELNKFSKIYIIDNLMRTNGSLRNIQHLNFNPKIRLIQEDITNFNFYQLKDHVITKDFENVSHFFHLAANRINWCAKYNRGGHDALVNGGFNVIDFCTKNGTKMFFSSTASVYQRPKVFPITEDSVCEPRTVYGSGKYYTENLIRSFDNMYGLDYTINRFFSVYGQRMDCEGSYTEIIFNILNNIKNGNNEVIIYGNPDEKVLDLVYVDDVVNAIILSTFNSNKHVFNVSTQDGVTISNLLKCVEEVTGVTLKINNLPENRTDIEPKRVGDISELKSLGWKAEVSLADGIRKTYEWIKTL